MFTERAHLASCRPSYLETLQAEGAEYHDPETAESFSEWRLIKKKNSRKERGRWAVQASLIPFWPPKIPWDAP